MNLLLPLATLLCVALCSVTLLTPPASAEVTLPALLSDHAVLQRDAPLHIWGEAAPGEAITVSLHGQKQSATADPLGKWSVYLQPEHAGGPYQLTVQATNTVTISDILIGDVWFASGQSNMEMPLSGFPGSAVLKNGPDEIAHADQPGLRLLHGARNSAGYPLAAQDATWTLCTPQTAAGFSAVAYFFGRAIHDREHVPVGLIDSTWGGTPAEAWTSLRALGSDASLMPVFRARAEMVEGEADLPARIAEEKRQDDAARTAGRPAPAHPWHPDPASWAPAGLFNAMVAPFTPFPIKGVIWYQGEANTGAGRAPLYTRLFSTLISDWRTQWAQGSFPFLFVQISSFTATPEEHWGLLRDAQRRTLELTQTAMAVTLDIGDPGNVHPADKQTVGARLALAARALAYGEPVEYSGPLFRQATPETSSTGPGLRVWFTHAAGLTARGEPQGFELAGDDHRFVPASARIENGTVLVTASGLAHPRYVRYAWANAPTANLQNGDGLPASTFSSEAEPQP